MNAILAAALISGFAVGAYRRPLPSEWPEWIAEISA
jgi:hypothetical protein